MRDYHFKIVYGRYEGLEAKAVDFLTAALSDYVNYSVTAVPACCCELSGSDLILVGTENSSPLLRELKEKGTYRPCTEAEGYSVKVTKSVYDEKARMIILAGADAAGTFYGACDFGAYVLPSLTSEWGHGILPVELFEGDTPIEYEKISSPFIKHRGIWTWGHVIYDYKKYLLHMAKLKMNTLILWNDYVPLNIREIIDEAHGYGIRIYLGFSWGWNEARPENGGLDISNESALKEIQESVVKQYERDYAGLPIDGIYFQTFTETKEKENHNIIIAERAVSLVNQTAAVLLERNPDLLIMFGLHATSVSDKLNYIRKTDPRVMIVWEDCGAFPYAYIPEQIDDYADTCILSDTIAALRGKDELFGIVSKGLVCLDWTVFEHQQGPFVMGQQSEKRLAKRIAEKKDHWKRVDAYWRKNADYAYDMIKLLGNANKNSLITGLIEDGAFDGEIHFAAAFYAEMLWDGESKSRDVALRVSLRSDVAN